jgi:formylglycine-generating enzyme required for sulfatase activity
VVIVAVSSLPATTAAEPKPDPTKQITNSIGMKLTLIPSAEFLMGSGESAEETAAFWNKIAGTNAVGPAGLTEEHPQHRVRITMPFYLGTYHVTRGQFRQFINDSRYITDAEKGRHPGAYGWDPRTKEFVLGARWFGDSYYAKSPLDDPKSPYTGEYRVLRGGSWWYSSLNARSATRGMSPPRGRSQDTGFRVARTQ